MFYTNVQKRGKYVLYRGYDNVGKRVQKKVEYHPKLFTKSDKRETSWQTIHGENVEPIKFEDCSEAYEFTQKYQNVEDFPIYGLTKFEYTFINELFPDGVEFDRSLIKQVELDIEVNNEDGNPLNAEYIESANDELTAITLGINGRYHAISFVDYECQSSNEKFYRVKDEVELINTFLKLWKIFDMDIVTGWNCEFFDIPYLYYRIKKLFDEKKANELSPWRFVSQRTVMVYGKPQPVFTLGGISILDYMMMYKKFEQNQRESYKLDHICHVELGERKLDYSEYGSLMNLWKEDPQKFIEYNIRDAYLIKKLDEKKKFIDQVLAIAYDAKVNYNDVFTQVRLWDVIIHNHLWREKKVIPPQLYDENKETRFRGAHVVDPETGMFKWVVSFDLNSLYPHLIMQYNIGPDTLIEGKFTKIDIQKVVSGEYPEVVEGACVAANGHYFSKNKQSFLNRLMEKMYDDRVVYKKMAGEYKAKYQETNDEADKILQERYDNLQKAKKIQLNSAYGALGNGFFRFFDIRQAEAITVSGQLSIHWIMKHMNDYLNRLAKTEGKNFIVAGDTDSMYVTLDHFIPDDMSEEDATELIAKMCDKYLEPKIDNFYQKLADNMNAYDQKMFMKREVIAEKAIWTGKKHYILYIRDDEGLRLKEPKLKIVGIEVIKSSMPQICKDAAKGAIKIILTGTEEELQAHVTDFEDTFKKQRAEDISKITGVSEIDKFIEGRSYRKGTPMHVRASILYNQQLREHKVEGRYEDITPGEKVKICYLMLPNPIGENVIGMINVLPEEFGLDKYVDYDIQFDKVFKAVLKDITTKIGWKLEESGTLDGLWS